MLTVEQRHALIVRFEAARCKQRAFERTHAGAGEQRLDAVLRTHIEDEAAQRDFYELVNSLTDWGMHPAAQEVRP